MLFQNSPTRFDLASVPSLFRVGFCHRHCCLSLETLQDNCRKSRKFAAWACCTGGLLVSTASAYLAYAVHGLSIDAFPPEYVAGIFAVSTGIFYGLLLCDPPESEKTLREFIRSYRRFVRITPMLSRLEKGGILIYPSDPNEVQDFLNRSLSVLKDEPRPGRYEIVCGLLEPFDFRPSDISWKPDQADTLSV